MSNNLNTDISGSQFSKEIIDDVWKKGLLASSSISNNIINDCCGTLIAFDDYGKMTEFGWHIDHINPKAKGGGDNLENSFEIFWEFRKLLQFNSKALIIK